MSCYRQKAASSWRFPQSWSLQQQAQAAAAAAAAAGLRGRGMASELEGCHLLNHQTSLGFPWSTDQTGTHPPPGFFCGYLTPRPKKHPSAQAKTAASPLPLGGPRQLPSRWYVTSPIPLFLPTQPPWMFNPQYQEAWGNSQHTKTDT